MSPEYLAGLLEGEGCFMLNPRKRGYISPTITVEMTDRDVVEKVAEKWGKRVSEHFRLGATKPSYKTVLAGTPALTQMIDIFPYMGSRRRQKINEILSRWEHKGARVKKGTYAS